VIIPRRSIAGRLG